MSDTFGEREFVRRLKAAPRKSAAVAAVLLIAAFGATVFLPLAYKTDATPKRRPPVKVEISTVPPEQVTEPARPIPDPTIGVSLIVPGDIPASVTTVGMQTVAVRAVLPGTGTSMFGTGFIVQDGIVVTAAHLLWRFGTPGSPSVDAYCDGRRFPAEVLARDDRRDVAILSAPGCTGERLKIGAYVPKHGHEDPLYATGYTFDASLEFAERFTHAAHPYDDEGWCAELDVGLQKLAARSTDTEPIMRYGAFTGALIHGNSGSPVIDEKGRVIGMFVILNEKKDFSCYVPGDEILKLLDTVR